MTMTAKDVECPVCGERYPNNPIDHPSFQACVPFLRKRIEELERRGFASMPTTDMLRSKNNA